jgi:dihydroflavonol-4-reductase
VIIAIKLKMKETVFVTGADGMLGTCICIELLKRNYAIKALVLSVKNDSEISKYPIEQIEGNILDEARLTQAMAGSDFIIHVAAATNVWPRKNKYVVEINFQGTQKIVSAAKKNRIKRMIHIGSASSFQNGNWNYPGDEKTLINNRKGIMDYVLSKLDAQIWLQNEHKNNGFPVIIICPTFMIGPYDSLPSSGKILTTFFDGKLPAYTAGGKNFVNTEDVATAVVNALKMGRLGESYISGNENLTYKVFLQKAAKISRRKFEIIKSPNFITILIGFSQSVFSRITKKEPKLSYTMAKNALIQQVYSSKKAVTELNMPQRPIEDGIERCYNWFKSNGKIK